MIKIEALTKTYGAKQALAGLTLTIEAGQIFGLLGHNGAGKSTTIKSLVSVIEPTSGTIEVDGRDLAHHRLAIKRQIGYVPDSPDLFLTLTPNEYWQLVAVAYQLDTVDMTARLAPLVQRFALTSHEDEVIGSFSHGMRQKVLIIGAMLPDPDIWILDEPLQGLDPQSAFELKQMMKEHAAKGKTVIFSTHVLETAQQICDEVAILKQGKLLYQGSVKQLLATFPNQSLEAIYLTLTEAKPTVRPTLVEDEHV